jgi:tRNA 2-thiouridine synthesizing protein B
MALVLIKHGVHHPIAEAKIECAVPGDSLVLIQDGVFWAITGKLEGTEADVYALQEDLCARGYQVENASVPTIGYSDLVDLIAKEEKTIT